MLDTVCVSVCLVPTLEVLYKETDVLECPFLFCLLLFSITSYITQYAASS